MKTTNTTATNGQEWDGKEQFGEGGRQLLALLCNMHVVK